MFKHAILGGTFAQFHSGHKKLLHAAFEQSQHITIGISQPILYKNKYLAHTIEDYQTRENYVKEYLLSKNWLQKATIIPIDAIWGSSLEDRTIEAIVVTEVTYPGAELINSERAKIAFPPLEIITVPLVLATDMKPITSERIRSGEIDREGNVYVDLFQNTLQMPEDMRESLRKPLGRIVKTTDEAIAHLNTKQIVISIGDVITTSLLEAQQQPDISIIDKRTRRHDITSSDLDLSQTIILNAENNHGTISYDAVQKINQLIKNLNASPSRPEPAERIKTLKHTLIIHGEEDLLALPAILLAPLGSFVLYGQYDRGIVVNEVTEEKKQKIAGLIHTFV